MVLNFIASRNVAKVMKNPMNARIHSPSTSAALTLFTPASNSLKPVPSSNGSAVSKAPSMALLGGYVAFLNATVRLRPTRSTSSCDALRYASGLAVGSPGKSRGAIP